MKHDNKENKDSMERLVEIVTSEVYKRLQAFSPSDSNPSVNCENCTVCGHPDCKTKSGQCEDCIGGVSKKPQTVQMMMNEGAVRFSSAPGQPPPIHSQLASMIDHTLLKPDVSHDQIKKLCEEAAKYHFATVCVNASNVNLAAKLLQGTDVKA